MRTSVRIPADLDGSGKLIYWGGWGDLHFDFTLQTMCSAESFFKRATKQSVPFKIIALIHQSRENNLLRYVAL